MFRLLVSSGVGITGVVNELTTGDCWLTCCCGSGLATLAVSFTCGKGLGTGMGRRGVISLSKTGCGLATGRRI